MKKKSLMHPIPKLASAIALAMLCALPGARAAEPAAQPASDNLLYPNLSPEDNERIAWWVDARYGMFIHWGVASIKGIELSWHRGGTKPLDIHGHPVGMVEDPVYDNLYKSWHPSEFDAEKWVQTAKAAGMKYMVLTAKHHDGFCLWDTKLTDYKITNTPFKRDVVGEFVNACRKANMKVGLYYSQRDWHHPDYGVGDNRKYIDYMNGQLTELLANYGPIDVIWFDSYGRGDLKTFWRIDETWQLIKRLAPKAVVNNRLAILAEYNRQGAPYLADFDTPEQSIGKMQTTRPWESCMCFVGHQWGFKPNGEMYSLEKLIHAIVSCATGDGNLLMNVGPMPTGEIEPRQAEQLKEAGGWLAKYGHTIYGTRGGPWQNAKWGGATRKGNSVFVHVFNWRDEETLSLLPLPEKVVSAHVLTGGSVSFKQSDKSLDLTVPAANHDPIDTIIELKLESPSRTLIQGEPIRSIFADGDLGEPITDGVSVSISSSGQGNHTDNLQRVFTPTNRNTIHTGPEENPWMAIDLGKNRNVKGMRIDPHNSGEKELETLVVQCSTDGKNWTEIWKCVQPDRIMEFPVTTLRAGVRVPGVEARHVRLMLKNPKARLAIYHVQIHGQ